MSTTMRGASDVAASWPPAARGARVASALEVPELDRVGDVEGLQQDGDFVGVRAGGVGVEGEGFEGVC